MEFSLTTAAAIIIAFAMGAGIVALIAISRTRKFRFRLSKELGDYWGTYYSAKNTEPHKIYLNFTTQDASGCSLEHVQLRLFAARISRARPRASAMANLIAASCGADWDRKNPAPDEVARALASLWISEAVWRTFGYDMHFDPELVRRLEGCAQPAAASSTA